MIGKITGLVSWQSPTQLLVGTAGGVSYEMVVTTHTYDALRTHDPADAASLYTYVQVKENPGTLCLYGFTDVRERQFFLTLIRVNDIGTTLAMRILSSAYYVDIATWIYAGEVSRLQGIKGVGRKIAERLVLELKDRSEEVV